MVQNYCIENVGDILGEYSITRSKVLTEYSSRKLLGWHSPIDGPVDQGARTVRQTVARSHAIVGERS